MNELIKKHGVSVVAGIVILLIGVGIGFMVARKGTTDTFQAGWNAAKQRLTESGLMFPASLEIASVSGVVQQVSDSNMTIKIHPLEPLADPSLDVRTVTFDSNTKFYQIKQKDQAQYQEELKAFSSKMQSAPSKGGAPVTPIETPPQPFTRVEIGKQDIKKDMTVSVTAGSNIKDSKTFVATEVLLQDINVPPAPTPVAQ